MACGPELLECHVVNAVQFSSTPSDRCEPGRERFCGNSNEVGLAASSVSGQYDAFVADVLGSI